jgi:hypothetical protein
MLDASEPLRAYKKRKQYEKPETAPTLLLNLIFLEVLLSLSFRSKVEALGCGKNCECPVI